MHKIVEKSYQDASSVATIFKNVKMIYFIFIYLCVPACVVPCLCGFPGDQKTVSDSFGL